MTLKGMCVFLKIFVKKRIRWVFRCHRLPRAIRLFSSVSFLACGFRSSRDHLERGQIVMRTRCEGARLCFWRAWQQEQTKHPKRCPSLPLTIRARRTASPRGVHLRLRTTEQPVQTVPSDPQRERKPHLQVNVTSAPIAVAPASPEVL